MRWLWNPENGWEVLHWKGGDIRINGKRELDPGREGVGALRVDEVDEYRLRR